MPRLTVTLDVDEQHKNWRLDAVGYAAPEGSPAWEGGVQLASISHDGFGPEEATLGFAIEHLDRTIDPTGQHTPLQEWWADTWARILDGATS